MISWICCVWFGLKLNSAGRWPSRNWVGRTCHTRFYNDKESILFSSVVFWSLLNVWCLSAAAGGSELPSPLAADGSGPAVAAELSHRSLCAQTLHRSGSREGGQRRPVRLSSIYCFSIALCIFCKNSVSCNELWVTVETTCGVDLFSSD